MVPGFLPFLDGVDELVGVDALRVADAVPELVAGLAHAFEALFELPDPETMAKCTW